jgi:hypothetical protein
VRSASTPCGKPASGVPAKGRQFVELKWPSCRQERVSGVDENFQKGCGQIALIDGFLVKSHVEITRRLFKICPKPVKKRFLPAHLLSEILEFDYCFLHAMSRPKAPDQKPCPTGGFASIRYVMWSLELAFVM